MSLGVSGPLVWSCWFRAILYERKKDVQQPIRCILYRFRTDWVIELHITKSSSLPCHKGDTKELSLVHPISVVLLFFFSFFSYTLSSVLFLYCLSFPFRCVRSGRAVFWIMCRIRRMIISTTMMAAIVLLCGSVARCTHALPGELFCREETELSPR